MKKELIKLIENIDLYNYTAVGIAYDPEFDKNIKKIRPDWFKYLKQDSNL